ncbi:unnamed protein product, partial [Discosporangium mesarthrocarpum]
EVVLLSPESVNPHRDVPRALLLSLIVVTGVCSLAALSLAGMAPAPDLSPDSGFAEAFRERGLRWAYQVGGRKG